MKIRDVNEEHKPTLGLQKEKQTLGGEIETQQTSSRRKQQQTQAAADQFCLFSKVVGGEVPSQYLQRHWKETKGTDVAAPSCGDSCI